VTARQRYVRHPWSERALGLAFIAELEGECPQHWVPLHGRQQVWCSIYCAYEFELDHGIIEDWAHVRRLALRRDAGTCQNCGLKAAVGLDMDERGNTVMEVDHIVEIQDGGDEFDLDNLRTLCKPCHATKTYARRHWKSPIMAERALKDRVRPLPPLEAYL